MFLGDEYNIVILNTVRSLPLSDIADHEFVQPDFRWRRENLGFLMDPHQINVAMTRARHGLIIIGLMESHSMLSDALMIIIYVYRKSSVA